MKPKNLLAAALVFAILVTPAFADFLDVSASLYANHSTNVTLRGYFRMDNSSGLNNTNITALLGNSNQTIFTNTSNSNWRLGFFEFNLTAPSSTGRFNVSLTANGTVTENIEIYVSNLTSVTFNFTEKRPPFANGSSFLMNISYAGRSNVVPKLEIFNPNGANSTGWTIRNTTSRVNAPSILYNITVPTNAEGRYVMVFEEGAGATIFLVKSSLVAVAEAQDSGNSTTANYGSGEVIKIIGKVRDGDNAILDANVTAFVTFPNGTVINFTMTHNGTGIDGSYNCSFNTSQFGAGPGSYKIDIVANVSGKIVRSSSAATIQALEARLDIVKDFFFDFGSSSAFQRGGIAEFNVLAFNLSNDILLNGSLAGAAGDVYCNATRVVEFKNVLNGSAEPSPALTKTTNLFTGQSVCKLRFTAPNVDGTYLITVNTSIGSNQASNLSLAATGYFSVQSYVLKPAPILAIGSGHEFVSFLMPGDNATFELAVRNLSASGAAVPGNLIVNFTPTRITPMDFVGAGQAEITDIVTIENTSGTATTNPKVKLKIPENKTGPFQIEFQATVNAPGAPVIRGNSFYFARYVEGFAFPGSFGGSFGHGGHEGGGEFGGFGGGSFKCSGNQNFSAKIFDVRTRQAARGVTFNSVQEAREELSGKSVKSQLSIAGYNSTDSNGLGNITISYSGPFSGFYFMLINITTSDGKSDTLPAGFECRQLSFFPQVQAIGSTGSAGFFVSPTSTLNISVSGIRNLVTGNQTQTGAVSITRLESFAPGKGHKAIAGPTTTYPLVSGRVAFTIAPSNFSGLGGKWLDGFNNLRVQVCDNSSSTPVCDTGFGGFMVVAFDAFLDFSTAPATTVSANTSVVYRVMARTNVTNFTAQIGLPWEGSVQDVTINSSTRVLDNWNSSADNNNFNGFEKWDVNMTMPVNIRKGFNMIIIKVNNFQNEQTEVMTFVSATKLAVAVPDTEGTFMTNMSVEGNASNSTQVSNFLASFRTNLQNISTTYNVNSKSGLVCARMKFNVTRFTAFQQEVVYSHANTTSVIILDNATPGVYDTLVINNSGSIGVVHSGNRSLASAGFPGMYLVEVPGCASATLLNSTLNGTGFGAGFGGQHAINSIAVIPMIVKQSGKAKANVFVDVSQMIIQQDFGEGRGGFGFQDFLPSSSFSRTGATTDANGVAFLRLNVSKSGAFGILWNLSDAGETDTADFSQSIPIEIKTFVTSGGVFGPHERLYIINLTRTRETGSFGVTINNTDFFLGTWNEAVLGPLINDGATHNHTIALRNVTHLAPGLPYTETPDFSEVVLDNDTNMCTNCTAAEGDSFSVVRFNWTDKLGPPKIMGDTLAVDGDRTINATLRQIMLTHANAFFSTFIHNTADSTSVRANVTVRVCAETFARPRTGLIGLNVSNATTRVFSFSGPPTTERLDMFDQFTGANVTSVLTGTSGCASFNVTRGSGWKTGFSNEIKTKVTQGANTEDVFVGQVYVACPSQGSCF